MSLDSREGFVNEMSIKSRMRRVAIHKLLDQESARRSLRESRCSKPIELRQRRQNQKSTRIPEPDTSQKKRDEQKTTLPHFVLSFSYVFTTQWLRFCDFPYKFPAQSAHKFVKLYNIPIITFMFRVISNTFPFQSENLFNFSTVKRNMFKHVCCS